MGKRGMLKEVVGDPVYGRYRIKGGGYMGRVVEKYYLTFRLALYASLLAHPLNSEHKPNKQVCNSYFYMWFYVVS